MAKTVINSLWYGIGVFFALFNAMAFAGTYPASVLLADTSYMSPVRMTECTGTGSRLEPFHGKTYSSLDAASLKIKAAIAIPVCPSGGAVTVAGVGPSTNSRLRVVWNRGGSYISESYIGYTLSCVNGGTLSGTTCTKTCPEGATMRADGTCSTPCQAAGTVVISDGYYDLGTKNTGTIPLVVCVSGCKADFHGYVPYGTSKVSGVTHYWAKGEYRAADPDFSACSGGDTAPGKSPSIPPDTCAATQGIATMNGKKICVDDAGNPVPDPSQPTTSPPRVTKVTNPDGSTTTTTETTKCKDGVCTTIREIVTTPASGSGGTGGGTGEGGGGDGGGPVIVEQPQSDFCREHPDDVQCKDYGDGDGDGENEEEETESGDGAGTGDLYQKGSRTVGNSLSEFSAKVQGSGFYSGISNFFTVSVGGGSCSGLSYSFNYGGSSFDVDMTPVFCGGTAETMYPVLKIGVMLAAMWVAFRIAFL